MFISETNSCNLDNVNMKTITTNNTSIETITTDNSNTNIIIPNHFEFPKVDREKYQETIHYYRKDFQNLGKEIKDLVNKYKYLHDGLQQVIGINSMYFYEKYRKLFPDLELDKPLFTMTRSYPYTNIFFSILLDRYQYGLIDRVGLSILQEHHDDTPLFHELAKYCQINLFTISERF